MSLAERFPKYFVALMLGAFLLFLAGIGSVGLWDRDEPRYAQASRQMVLTGDWVVPRYPSGEWRLEKPPAIYWCQAISMELFGQTAFALRLPSVLGATAAMTILGLTVRRLAGPKRALWTVFIFCTSGLAIAASKMAITDAVLLSMVITGQACLAFCYWAAARHRRAQPWVALIFWTSAGFAGLVKGPQGLLMHVMTLLILLVLDVAPEFKSAARWRSAMQWWRQLHPWWGVPILAIVVSPWMILIHHRAPGFLSELILKAKMHSTQSMDGHGEPPGYHTLLIFGTFFPWSLLLPTTITLAYRNHTLPHIRFAIAATAGPWLLMEMVYTKLPFYVLPAFGGLSFLTADALIRCIRGRFDDLRRPIFMVTVGVWAVVVLGLAAAPWLSLKATHQLPLAAMAGFSAFGILYAAIVFFRFYQGKIARAAMAMGGGMALLIAILYIGIFPHLQFLRMSENIVAALGEFHATGKDAPLAMIGYKEPSLAFYQGTGAREQDDNYLQITPPDRWPKWIVIEKQQWDDLPPELKGLLQIRASVNGVMYAVNGRPATALVVEKMGTEGLDQPITGVGNGQ